MHTSLDIMCFLCSHASTANLNCLNCLNCLAGLKKLAQTGRCERSEWPSATGEGVQGPPQHSALSSQLGKLRCSAPCCEGHNLDCEGCPFFHLSIVKHVYQYSINIWKVFIRYSIGNSQVRSSKSDLAQHGRRKNSSPQGTTH